MVWYFKAGEKHLNGKSSFPSKIPQNHYIQVTKLFCIQVKKLLCMTPAQVRGGNNKSDFFPY